MTDHGTLAADEAFKLLGEETRLEILRTVWAADDVVSFTEIRNRMGSPDSGKFNYHINKLRGPFLTADDQGYRLTQAGREVIRAVMAGTVTDRPTRGPTPINAECSECTGTLTVRYDGYASIDCDECGTTVMWNEFPPAGLAGRRGEAFATAFDRWTRTRFRLAMDGICPCCAAATSSTVFTDDTEAPVSLHRCPNCQYEARVPLFGHVLDHPAVVARYYEADIDVSRTPYWDLRRLANEFDERVTADDPWRARISIDIGDRPLVLTLDERLEVVDVDGAPG